MRTPNPKEKETQKDDSNKKDFSINNQSQKIENFKENPKIILLARPEKTNFFDNLKLKAQEVEAKAGITNRLVLSIIGIASLFILFGFCENFFSNFIGIFYPLFGSIKSLETDELEDDKMWLTYWVVFSLYFIIEMVIGFLLRKIPLYFLFKATIFVYLYLPYTQGAEIVYNKFIKSAFIKCERNVDKLLTELQDDTKNISKNAKDLFNKQASEVLNILSSDKNEKEESNVTPKDFVVKKNQ